MGTTKYSTTKPRTWEHNEWIIAFKRPVRISVSTTVKSAEIVWGSYINRPQVYFLEAEADNAVWVMGQEMAEPNGPTPIPKPKPYDPENGDRRRAEKDYIYTDGEIWHSAHLATLAKGKDWSMPLCVELVNTDIDHPWT